MLPACSVEMQLAVIVMNDKRRTPRTRVLKFARIVLDDKAPKIECTLRNVSEGGCLIQVSTTLGIPHEFELIMPDGVRRHCVVVRRSETHMGLAFKG